MSEIVLKAQIHAGGRGKGTFSSGLKGGVQLTKEYEGNNVIVQLALTCAHSPKVVGELASKMLGFSLVTKQTPPGGVVVKKVRDQCAHMPLSDTRPGDGGPSS